MIKERELQIQNILSIIDFIELSKIDNGQVLRVKKSRKTGKEIKLIYYIYLDLYIINEMYFTNQLKAIYYFNSL